MLTLNLSDKFCQDFLTLERAFDVVLLADKKLKGDWRRGFEVTRESNWDVDRQNVNCALDSLGDER